MRSLKHFIILLIFAAVLALVIFGRTEFNAAYQQVSAFVSNLFSRSISQEFVSKLLMENQRLRFELEQITDSTVSTEDGYRRAHVYSRYPFNDREVISIDLGSNDGIAVGMPVVTTEQFFLGKVTAVRNRQSEVQTIFDSSWRSSVAIGESGNKAVLRGGQHLRLELIARTSNVVGVQVFNIAPDFPFHQLIGTVEKITDHPGEPWQTGRVAVPYDAGNITEVLVVVNFP